jgi:hypothetical protein
VLLPSQHFEKYIDQIGAIRGGFALFARMPVKSATNIVGLLKPPKGERDRLIEALPENLKGERDPSMVSRLFRWVEKLIERPGFLFDSLWAATLIGLNADGFDRAMERFKKTRYRGIFAFEKDARWWASSLVKELIEEVGLLNGEMSWNAGRRLSGINAKQYSKCYSCGNEYPETVAYVDEVSVDRKPMHLQCTVLHPRYKRELYFEDIRMMRG